MMDVTMWMCPYTNIILRTRTYSRRNLINSHRREIWGFAFTWAPLIAYHSSCSACSSVHPICARPRPDRWVWTRRSSPPMRCRRNSTNPRAAPAGIARVEPVRPRPPRNRWLQLSIQSESKSVVGGWTSLREKEQKHACTPSTILFFSSIRGEVDSSRGTMLCDHLVNRYLFYAWNRPCRPNANRFAEAYFLVGWVTDEFWCR